MTVGRLIWHRNDMSKHSVFLNKLKKKRFDPWQRVRATLYSTLLKVLTSPYSTFIWHRWQVEFPVPNFSKVLPPNNTVQSYANVTFFCKSDVTMMQEFGFYLQNPAGLKASVPDHVLMQHLRVPSSKKKKKKKKSERIP